VIIDMHVHPYCKDVSIIPDVESGLKAQFESKYRANSKQRMAIRKKMFTEYVADDIIKLMDESGIDRAVIVAFDMTTQYGVVMVTNEDVSGLGSRYPNRFIPFASVDPSTGRAAVEELEHAIVDLGCKGLKLCPPVQKFDISDSKLNQLWDLALDMDIVVWTHTAHQMGHFGSDARLGHPMLVEPVAHRYPDLKIVLGHCGFPWVWEAWSLVTRHPNVYVDISAYIDLYNYFPWDAYIKYGAEERVLFATDYPVRTWKQTLAALNEVDIPTEFKKKILGENARRLLNL